MAKKIKSTIWTMSISLLVISGVMAAALGYVYSVTKDPIDKAKLKKVNDAIAQVVPAFTNDPSAEKIVIEKEKLELYPAKNGDSLVGVAVKTYTKKAFSGEFSIMVGFLPDGTIYNTAVLDQKETPGLGAKMTQPEFKDQFKNMNSEKNKITVKQDGGDVDAITASTISSRAYCDAIARAYNEFKKQFVK
jgi:Na+-translocating ferredoxin:NAD+ oxidoreductase subunit G